MTIIFSGSASGGSYFGFTVPKRELVSNLAILLQSDRLKIPRSLPEATAMIEELQNFAPPAGYSSGRSAGPMAGAGLQLAKVGRITTLAS